MNRRKFLKSAIALPAVAAVPFVAARPKHGLPEVRKLAVDDHGVDAIRYYHMNNNFTYGDIVDPSDTIRVIRNTS